MALTETQICNMALSLFGDMRISSIDDATETANLCKLWYEQCRDEVLSESGVEWRFAIVRVQLTQCATAPSFGWTYQYQLPDGLLKIIKVLNVYSNTVYPYADIPMEYDINWKREGDKIMTNWTECYLHYVKQETDVTKYPKLLVKAIYTLLASVLAGRIANNPQKSLELLQEYEAVLSKAKSTNSEECYVENEEGSNDWTSAGRY